MGAPPPAAILVLGAETRTGPDGADVGPLTLERLRRAADLQRETGLPLLVTAGVTTRGAPPLAELMRQTLEESFRVPVRWVEPAARNTAENATRSAAILAPEGIASVLLVTHAWHMRRARAEVGRAGLVAWPAAGARRAHSRRPARRLDAAPRPSGDELVRPARMDGAAGAADGVLACVSSTAIASSPMMAWACISRRWSPRCALPGTRSASSARRPMTPWRWAARAALARIRRLLPGALGELAEMAYGLVSTARLARAARAFRPDIIYERANLFHVAGSWTAWRRGVPLLLEVNAPLAEERIRFSGLRLKRLAHAAERFVWRCADIVLPVTEVLAGHVTAAGVPRRRIAVVPNGIDLEDFARLPARAASEAVQLGFVGFVRHWHGLDRVLRGLAAWQGAPRLDLTVVGDGPARVDLESLAVELGLGDRVRFTGLATREEIPRLVAGFDIALQPASVPYASPLKLFEYMAAGRGHHRPRPAQYPRGAGARPHRAAVRPGQPRGDVAGHRDPGAGCGTARTPRSRGPGGGAAPGFYLGRQCAPRRRPGRTRAGRAKVWPSITSTRREPSSGYVRAGGETEGRKSRPWSPIRRSSRWPRRCRRNLERDDFRSLRSASLRAAPLWDDGRLKFITL